jgi:hypothetical protein
MKIMPSLHRLLGIDIKHSRIGHALLAWNETIAAGAREEELEHGLRAGWQAKQCHLQSVLRL